MHNNVLDFLKTTDVHLQTKVKADEMARLNILFSDHVEKRKKNSGKFDDWTAINGRWQDY